MPADKPLMMYTHSFHLASPQHGIMAIPERLVGGVPVVVVPLTRAVWNAMVERASDTDGQCIIEFPRNRYELADNHAIIRKRVAAGDQLRAALTLPAEWEPSDG